MKPSLIHLVESSATPIQGRNLAREYLQAWILRILQQNGGMIPLAFHGVTALRFLYSIPRYSEALDFALERPDRDYDFRKYLASIRREFLNMNYAVEIKFNDSKTVHSAFVRFPGLLFELGLSPHEDDVLAVKLEIDTHPPASAGLETTIIRRHVLLNLQHHDRASLLAGKLHALLQRSFIKGRDLYDLLWYLSDPSWPEPNLTMLNNALGQTNWSGDILTSKNWRNAVRQRIEAMSWDRVVADVNPFIEQSAKVELLTRDNLLNVLQSKIN